MSITITSPLNTSLTSPATYSTTLENVFIYGIVDPLGDDLTIDIDGYTYSYNAGDILIDGTKFTFPHPSTSPDGYPLLTGTNEFVIKTNNVTFYLDLILPSEQATTLPTPPQLSIERQADDVLIKFLHTDTEVSYYNIYASIYPFGGTTGYQKINAKPLDPISYGFPIEATSTIASETLDIKAETADPLYTSLNFIQSSSDTVLKTDIIFTSEVAETVKNLRLTTSLSSVEFQREIRFAHNRVKTESSIPPTILIADFSTIPLTAPLYYVATAVKVVDGTEVESKNSSEVASFPVNVNSTNIAIPVVPRNDLIEDVISKVLNLQPDLAVQPGSIARDLIIDPFVSEMERARFILDFVYRSTSFTTLLDIDDPLSTGTSILVANSNYKQGLAQSLFFTNQSRIQTIIDNAFDKLATNFGVLRKTGSKAIGEAIFYTTSTPTRTINIPKGTTVSGNVSFITTQNASIDLGNVTSYYNPVKRRYQITVPIQASEAGISGNIASGQIKSTSVLGVLVTNESATFGGSDAETNRNLANRALAVLSSVDTGTRSGYERLTRSIPGVVDSLIISADSIYQYRGAGCVDIWIRGESIATVTDTFAPTFQIHRDSLFIPIGDESLYLFKLDSNQVIASMLNTYQLGLGLRNNTTNEYFNLTGYTIVDDYYIQVDTSLVQPAYSMTDVITGDWQEPISEKIILARQPVTTVTSVVDEDGVALIENTDWIFVKKDDPLRIGNSRLAQSYVELLNITDYERRSVDGESATLIGFYRYQLNKKGVDVYSILVYSPPSPDLPSVLYKSSFEEDPDYLIEVINGITYITRTANSTILDGQSVLLSYSYAKNHVITYQTNLIVQSVQNSIDTYKHLTADVLVKECSVIPIDIKANVIVRKGYSSSTVDQTLRSNLTVFLSNIGLGGTFRISDIIRLIDATDGVSYVDVPITKLAIAEGTLILREEIIPITKRDLNDLSSNAVAVYLIDTELVNKVVDGLGGGGQARIYGNGREFTLLNATDRLDAPLASYTASFIGADGLTINTIPVVNSANKIMVSIPRTESIFDYTFELNYYTASSEGVVQNVAISVFSYFTPGTFSFTYKEDTI